MLLQNPTTALALLVTLTVGNLLVGFTPFIWFWLAPDLVRRRAQSMPAALSHLADFAWMAIFWTIGLSGGTALVIYLTRLPLTQLGADPSLVITAFCAGIASICAFVGASVLYRWKHSSAT